ncbi:MAG: NFACT RNA binding domain-containing protein [Bacteroidia bacterium]|jgi:hypothetical protein|nr:NFACT RNA binding domain-containing protein [Bacteroidia bacterium]
MEHSYHQHYFVIRDFSLALANKLTNAVLRDAYTTSKHELVICFDRLTIKVAAKFRKGFIWTTAPLTDKGSNAQSCFEQVFNQQVKEVVQHTFNRSFAIRFNDAMLVFKCYDGLINVLLVSAGEVVDVFRKSIESDYEFDEASLIGKEEQVPKYLVGTYKPRCYSIMPATTNGSMPMWLHEDDKAIVCCSDIFEALAKHAAYALGHLTFYTTKEQLLKSVRDKQKWIEKQLFQTEAQRTSFFTQKSPEELGHHIMANLHVLKPGDECLVVKDFYNESETITIKLNKQMSAVENAERYYRMARNRKIELQTIEEKLARLQQQQMQVLEQEILISKSESIKQLKPFIKEQEVEEVVFPFRRFMIEGYEVWVGKHAKNNDELTLHYAHKNDLWLHAKDVSGSHVVVKWKSGKPYPNSVIEKAASIAAYYSKLKGSGLIPVTYTEKKFVRKPKGFAPGMVAVDKEQVIIVEPGLPNY